MAADSYPLILEYNPDRPFAWRRGEAVDCGRAMAEILFVSEQLTPGRAYLNLCEDRYFFTLVFAAVCLADGTNLLPASHAAGALQGVRDANPDADEVDDQQLKQWLASAPASARPTEVPSIGGSHCTAVVYTSGSTGTPTAHKKFWRDLHTGTHLWRQRFFPDTNALNIVATVPPQHMFGLETSVLPVLQAGFAAHVARPCMPWEIADALADIPAPRVLITTPVHLRACVRAGTPLPEIHRCISATAPLSAKLAEAAETLWKSEVHEIYGCSEAGSLASRHTSAGDAWTLYAGMQLQATPSSSASFVLLGPQLPDAVPLTDELQLLDDHQFRLLGRSQEMLKVAGKRISLGELTQRLLDIDGVIDAVAFLPEGKTRLKRPAALVVAPGLEVRSIATQLAGLIDPVFVPRPLLKVEALPRNTVGKLPRAALQDLLQRARKRQRPA